MRGKNRCNKLFLWEGQRVRWTGRNYNTNRIFVITGLYPQILGRFEWKPSSRLSQTSKPSYLSYHSAAATWVEHWHLHCSDCRNILIYPHDLEHPPEVWRESRLAKITCLWSWRLCGINPDYIHKVSVGLSDNLQHDSHKPVSPPTSVTILHLRREYNIDTCTAETYWSTRTTWRTLLRFDVSLGSPNLPVYEAGDFVELILIYPLFMV